jgi:cytochrome c oxidase cbb3-type subunit 2
MNSQRSISATLSEVTMNGSRANREFLVLLVGLAGALGATGGALTYYEPHLLRAKLRPGPSAKADLTPIVLSASAEAGHRLYQDRCSGCHGAHGNARTRLAEGLSPRPRDFTKGIVKFKSTPWNAAPTRDDLIAVVSNGVRWSAMPPFAGRLTATEIEQISDYLMEEFFSRGPQGFPPPLEAPEPPELTPALAERGRGLFDLRCAPCHGLHGQLDAPRRFHDVWGDQLFPRDLTLPVYKQGTDPGSLYLRIALGIAGTPMTDVGHGLSEEETWSIVAYVVSLQRQPESFVERGALLYRGMGCVQCHGEEGAGGVRNPNYVKGTPPALDTLAERMFLDFEEDVAVFIGALERSVELAENASVLELPSARRILGKYQAVTNVIRTGSSAAKADSAGPTPPLHMPSWYPHLTNEEIDELIAYLLSLYEEDEA